VKSVLATFNFFEAASLLKNLKFLGQAVFVQQPALLNNSYRHDLAVTIIISNVP
jgi:hypothetical protein